MSPTALTGRWQGVDDRGCPYEAVVWHTRETGGNRHFEFAMDRLNLRFITLDSLRAFLAAYGLCRPPAARAARASPPARAGEAAPLLQSGVEPPLYVDPPRER